jgi:hypothetical protein
VCINSNMETKPDSNHPFQEFQQDIGLSKTFWQTIFTLCGLFTALALIFSVSRAIELKLVLARSAWSVVLLGYLLALVGYFVVMALISKKGLESLAKHLELAQFNARIWNIVGWILFIAALLAIPLLKFTLHSWETAKKSTQDPFLTLVLFFWLAWWLILLATAGIKLARHGSWAAAFAIATLASGVAYEIFMRFQAISTYPFSMSWSETSRFYYASLYFSQALYGEKFPLSALHPTRYFLQSFPFLFPGLGLAAHRFWQFLLWIGLTGISAFVLAQRIFLPVVGHGKKQNSSGLKILLAGFLFLFFLRVGVYYHLEVMVFLPLLFISSHNPWRTLAVVAFTSLWAGISRVNWFPVPAAIAIVIYLLEKPVEKEGPSSSGQQLIYLRWPFIWAISGLCFALMAQALYIPLSGNVNNIQVFISSFSSVILLNRLWPNDSYPLGVIPAIFLLSAPLLLVIAQSIHGHARQLHWIRHLGLWSILTLFFVGGLIVSTKIGGGGDLHNMDTYAVITALIGTYFLFGKVSGESGASEWGQISWLVIAAGLLIPLAFILPALAPLESFDPKTSQKNLKDLTTFVEQSARQGPVLFINERHLVTFGDVKVPLIPDYEAVTLMEMAMSGNRQYLDKFYSDLKNHRFSAIVTDKQNLVLKDEGSFANENNVWNMHVGSALLCYYESARIFDDVYGMIEIYVPRIDPCQLGEFDQ